MFRSFSTFLLLVSTLPAISQSKLVPVSQSELTGCELPDGSKQDKRILSTAAAKTLLQMKAEENAMTLGEEIEVFSLVISTDKQTEDQVKLAVQKAGWSITPFGAESMYTLLMNNGRTIMMYLESLKKETALYLMPVVSVQPPLEAPTIGTQITPSTQTQVDVAPERPTIDTLVVEVQPKQIVLETNNNEFTFNTINFDDGWTSTVATDFVKVDKGSLEVLLYYSVEITDEMRNSNVELSDYYWNLLVVPNFTVRSAQRFVEGVTYFRTYFIEGEAVDPKTGRPCYLALNVLVNSGVVTPVLAISPDRNSYTQVFPEPKNLGDMTGYNKFAVSAKDIIGSWSSNTSSAVNLYNTYTGNYAGMNSTQSSDTFVFNADGTYSSKHSGASSVYGNNTYYTQEYKGKLTVTNWDITMTNRWKDATNNYFAQFEVIRGGRILHLQDKEASGIRYHLVRAK